MKRESKLNSWVREGFIDEDTASQIKQYEEQERKPLLLYAVSGLGGLAIFLGLISIIASNWTGIPNSVKIICDLALGAYLCSLYWYKESALPRWGREVLICVISGWTIASIALIGQTYQLGGVAREALLFRLILIAPLLAQGRSRLTGAILLGACILTGGYWIDQFSAYHKVLISISRGIVLGIFALSTESKLKQKRPEIAEVFRDCSASTLLIAASFIPIYFYHGVKVEIMLPYLAYALLSIIPGAIVLWRPTKGRSQIERAVLLATIFCMITPFLNPRKNLDLIGMIYFIGFWGLIAKAALDGGRSTLFRFATLLIAVRLVTIYFELVGTLMNTGLLFLSGGVMILLMTRYWYTKQRDMLDVHLGGEA